MQTSTTTDKVSLPRRWMQPTAVMLWVLIWQLAAMAVNIPLLLPSPVVVLQRLWQLCGEGEFWYTVLTSLCRILLGFAAGVAAGVLLAAAAWRWQFVQAMVRPMVGVLKSTPVASFIILALVWVKTEQLATLISFIMVLPLVYNNLCQGIAAADPKLLEMAKVFELSGWKTFRCCYLPAILPFFLSAVSSALGLAWKSGIAAEVLGRPLTAIGTKIYESKVYLETADLFAWTLVIILLSVILDSSSVPTLLFAMCVTGWCPIARLVRSQMLQISSSEYVMAAKVMGVKPLTSVVTHFIPNTLSVIIVNITFRIPGFIFSEAFLSYVGLGVQPPATSWGALCSAASLNFLFYPYQLVAPAGLIALTMLCFTLIGDGLRDALDPKLRR